MPAAYSSALSLRMAGLTWSGCRRVGWLRDGDVIDVMESLGAQVDDLRVTGQPAGNAVWNQMKADSRENHPRATFGEAELLGDLCLALVALGEFFLDWRSRRAFVSIERTFQPDDSKKALYDELFSIYRESYKSLIPVFGRLAALQLLPLTLSKDCLLLRKQKPFRHFLPFDCIMGYKRQHGGNSMPETKVVINLSNRHIHVSREDLDILFGKGYKLTKTKDLIQPASSPAPRPSQKGPKSAFEGVRFSARTQETQCEILATINSSSVYPDARCGNRVSSMEAPLRDCRPAGSIKKDRG